MRVLHLGGNSASQMDITVAALGRIGIEARGLCLYGKPTQSGEHIEIQNRAGKPSRLLSKISDRYRWWKAVSRAIRWADVVHCYAGPQAFKLDLDLWYIWRKKKARLIEFLGSDIRTDEVAASGNPYLDTLLKDKDQKYSISREASRERQSRYARYGFQCATSDPELTECVMKDLFPSHYLLRARVNLSKLVPAYPAADDHRPVIVHMPSNPALKGTPAVLKAIEEVREAFDIDFRLLQGMEHEEALEVLRSCDLMLDQFVIGTHGVASIEAMAFGKPVISYIKPAYLCRLPKEFPIISANQETLAGVIKSLLQDRQKLHTIGRLSRAYVEKYHDDQTIARQLQTIYAQLLRKGSEGNCER